MPARLRDLFLFPARQFRPVKPHPGVSERPSQFPAEPRHFSIGAVRHIDNLDLSSLSDTVGLGSVPDRYQLIQRHTTADSTPRRGAFILPSLTEALMCYSTYTKCSLEVTIGGELRAMEYDSRFRAGS
jgi:hypothetical protein